MMSTTDSKLSVVQDLEKRLLDALNKEREVANKQIQALKEEQIQALKEQDKQIQALREEQEKQIQALREEQDDAKEAQDKQIRALTEEQDKQIQALREEQDDAKEQLWEHLGETVGQVEASRRGPLHKCVSDFCGVHTYLLFNTNRTRLHYIQSCSVQY